MNRKPVWAALALAGAALLLGAVGARALLRRPWNGPFFPECLARSRPHGHGHFKQRLPQRRAHPKTIHL